MSIAYVRVSPKVPDKVLPALQQYIVVNRLATITGVFQNTSPAFTNALGSAGAVGMMPSYQALPYPQSRGMDALPAVAGNRTHPTYFVFFGAYTEMSWPRAPRMLPAEFVLADIEEEMIPVCELPEWPHNDIGSAYVQHLGKIKMKHPDFNKWCQGTFETTLWIGQATPSKSSQFKRKGKGKGKRKGNW